ncbi:hypothetical protein AB0C45_04435 [Streptomyces cyaneofuscatus]|uniref:hypothetical protein n=1 Tax=Streptomyces cyaneofuscatus TaxID=66883 RepID=UPI0033D56E8E
MTDFVTRHQEEINQTLSAIQRIGKFSAATMAIVEELGWHQNHAITAPSLLLWSGGIEEFSPQPGEPHSLQRMVRAGGDLQMTHLLHALVGAAVSRQQPAAATSRTIIHALMNAAVLLGKDANDAAYSTYRMWRVAFLPGMLMPSAPSPSEAKVRYREFAHRLEGYFIS